MSENMYYYRIAYNFAMLDPNNPDTDADGLRDGDEQFPTQINVDGINTTNVTDPTNRDSDGDGLMDGNDVVLTKPDTMQWIMVYWEGYQT
jgi:hypothetical protein